MADDDGFIGLPPGVVDSGTFKSPPRTERQTAEKNPIVFLPTVPGAPVQVPAAAPSEPELETRRELDDEFTPPALGRHALVGWALELPDGSRAVVETRLLVGRNPAHLDGWEGAVLLAVNDTTHSVSKTHAAFEVDDSGLWVHDLSSTNGVWVVVGEDATEVAPGRRAGVSDGSVVELGDFVVRVSRA